MSVTNKGKQTQINLNEEWAISSDEMNLILRKRQRSKKTNEFTDNYTNVGYYSNVESLLTRLNNEVVLSHIQGLESLDELVRVTESYLSKLHDDVSEVVKELRNNQTKEIK